MSEHKNTTFHYVINYMNGKQELIYDVHIAHRPGFFDFENSNYELVVSLAEHLVGTIRRYHTDIPNSMELTTTQETSKEN